MYALEQRNGANWTRCAQCGKRALLEKVQAYLKYPQRWRIVYVAETQNDLFNHVKSA